jgi:DNA-binding transcriptional LysR family regulator
MLDLRAIEAFYWAVRLNSFRRAAKQLDLSQSTVSQRIASLESELKLKLFDRIDQSARLSAEGHTILSYAERIVSLQARMIQAAASPVTVNRVLRLGVSQTIVETWLPDFISRFHASYPQIILDVEVAISPELCKALIGHDLDLAFLLGPVNHRDVTNYRLCQYSLAFVARSDIDLGAEPIALERLLELPIITLPKGTRIYIALQRQLTHPDLPPPRLYSNASLSTIVRMTKDGIGVSVIPAAVIAGELRDGHLKLIKTEIELPSLAFTASWPAISDVPFIDDIVRLACETAEREQPPDAGQD